MLYYPKKVGILCNMVIYYHQKLKIRNMDNDMKILILLLTAMIFAGCTNIDYTGRKFTPQENVTFVKGIENVPAGYTLIGRFTMVAPPRTHEYYAEDDVMEKAREFGGDILCYTGANLRPHGVYTPNELEFGTPDLSRRKVSETEQQTLGEPVPLQSSSLKYERKHFHFLLYKKSEEVNRQLGF